MLLLSDSRHSLLLGVLVMRRLAVKPGRVGLGIVVVLPTIHVGIWEHGGDAQGR